MISDEVKKSYKVSIGIECHVQLKTATKLFAGVGNDARGAEPNTLISYICLGMPGALPVINEKAIELATRAAFALNSPPQKVSSFDRKHYFYPDLPMGYQITQFNQPIIRGGHVDIEVDGQVLSIGIHEAHLEADAGKNTHPDGADYSLVDLNRAGTPLLEIVSEPEMHSPVEAKVYAKELFLLMKYAGVSDCDLYHGNMRFDVNVSVSKTNELGTRTETKNLNSFKSVEKAAEYEIQRQIELLEKKQVIVQETRGWDEAKQKTVNQRGKEFAHDYRYMPDPDLPPVVLNDELIKSVKHKMSLLPADRRSSLRDIGIDLSSIDILLEAEVQDEHIQYFNLIDSASGDQAYAKQLVNWLVNIELPLRNDQSTKIKLAQKDRGHLYSSVYKLINDKQLSSSNARILISQIQGLPKLPESITDFADQQGLIQVSNNEEIDEIVTIVLRNNPQAVEDIKKGETKAFGFLVGQVMKDSKGKANPVIALETIKKHLK